MSWEDCGFKPGKIYGPKRCARQCGDCDGRHHFLAKCIDQLEDDDAKNLPAGLNTEAFFKCKHCSVMAEMVDDPMTEDE